VVYLLFFLSGAAGLVYEIAWSRSLGLFFGHTAHAAAVVLGAYFAGMALGYWLAGRISARLRAPLAAYGIAELVVAAWALLTPHLLALYSRPGLAALLNHDDPGIQLAVRAAVTFITLLPATIALGATLPFIAQHVAQAGTLAADGRRIALAYACNTAGAFAGVMLATYVLILHLGVQGSGNLAAGLSAACGLTAIWWSQRSAAPRPERSVTDEHSRSQLAPSWYVLAGLSGLGTLGLQVLYTRLFALTFHNSTYTFGGVVAVFLIALSLGSWLSARLGRRLPPTPGAAIACALGAPLILLGVAVFQNITRLGYFTTGADFAQYILAALGLIALVVLVPTTLLGAVLPYAFAVAPAGSAVGRLTAVNTICAAIGALATSFVLLPAFGLWNCFALYALVYTVALPALGLGLLLAAGVVGTQWPRSVKRGMELLYERDTAYGLITVLEQKDSGERWLKQNNHYTLGATSGYLSEERQGHIPLMLHPEPREVCFLGLATGITAGAALAHSSVEHYRAARARLAEGGIFCQWIPLYQVGPSELKLIADSFRSVFPVVTVWRGELESTSPLLALVGSEQPLHVDGTALMVRWAQVEQAREDSDDVIRQGKDLLQLYVGGWPRNESSWLNTDDFPRVEFLAPITHRDRVKLTKQRLVDYYSDVLLNLPLTGIEYVPLAAEPMPGLGAGRLQQRDEIPLD
jgi:spermidine synthase